MSLKFIKIVFLTLSFNCVFAQFGSQQLISADALSAQDVFAVDIDGDGDIDVLSASEGDNKIAWFENLDGIGTFSNQHVITDNLFGTRDVIAADVDGDGDMDVLATSLGDDIVVWFENLDGLGNCGEQIIITNLTDGVVFVYSSDIDNDGDMDVLSASAFDGKIAWYENLDGLGNFGSQRIINTTISARSLFPEDLDGDGDKDILCDSSSTSDPSWYENLDGLGNFGTEQIITQDTIGAQFTIAADLDGDGDMDFINLEFGGNTIAWFENTNGLGNFGPKRVISSIYRPVEVFAADFDNDGEIDLVSINHDNDGVTAVWLHENIDGLGNFSEKQVISSDILGGRGVYAADIDNDGDMDVLSASIIDDKIAWYENLTILGVGETIIDKASLYPNPVKNILKISNTDSDIISVVIYNILGKKVLDKTGNITQINMASLASGLYLVKIKTASGVLVKKW